ncbi:MAG TPA: hypothetical protein VJP79_12155 [Nitrososphaera sp.]|nr:hypothetical protein [Nitrososphaera sp.]
MAAPLVFSGTALAHGPPPGGCAMYHGLEYASEITSFTVDDGNQEYDVLANPQVTIPVNRDQDFTVQFTLHTDPLGFRVENGSKIDANSSSEEGYAWYRNFGNGYPFSICAGPVQGDSDLQLSDTYTVSQMFQGEGPHLVFFETSLDDSRPKAEFYLDVAESMNETDIGQDDAGPSVEDDEQEEEQLPPESNMSGTGGEDTVLAPFISQSELTESASDQPDVPEADMLTINGTIASLSPLSQSILPPQLATNSSESDNDAEVEGGGSSLSLSSSTTNSSSTGPHIISGQWFMSVNDTAVSAFQANFTVVSADGSERDSYRLSGFAPVNSSAVQFDSNLIAISSSSSMISGEGEQNVSLVITLERLNAVRLDFDATGIGGNVTGPIYGIVDKLVLSSEGEQVQVIQR